MANPVTPPIQAQPETNTWTWTDGKRKEGQTAEQLYGIGIKYMERGGEEEFSKITSVLKNRNHWSDDEIEAFSKDIRSGTEAQTKFRSGARPPAHPEGSFTLDVNTPAGRAYQIIEDETPTWLDNYNSLKKELKNTDSEITTRKANNQSLFLSNDPSNYRDLEVKRDDIQGTLSGEKNKLLRQLSEVVLDGERLDYIWGTDEANKRVIVYRRTLQNLIQADNPDWDFRYDERGLFAAPKGEELKEVTPSLYKQFTNLATDATFIGAEIALGSVLAGSPTAAKFAKATNNRFLKAGIRGAARLGPGMLLASAGAIALDNYQQNRIAEDFQLFLDSEYDRFTFSDDIAINAMTGPVSYSIGGLVSRSTGLAKDAYKGVKHAIKGGGVSDEVVDVLSSALERDKTELVKSAREWAQAYKGDDGIINLPTRRRWFGTLGRVRSETESMKEHNLTPYTINTGTDSDIPDAELVFRYIMDTDELGVHLTKNMFDKYPNISARMLINGATNRSRAISEELKGDITPEKYSSMMDEINSHSRNIRAVQNQYAKEINESVLFDEKANKELIAELGPKFEKFYQEMHQSGTPVEPLTFMHWIREVKRSGQLSAQEQTKADLAVINLFAGNNPRKHALMQKLFKSSDELDNLGLKTTVKALNTPNISPDEAMTIIEKLNVSAWGTRHYDKFMTNIRPANRVSVEAGIVNLHFKNATKLIPQQYGESSVTNWIQLAQDLKAYKPYTNKGKELKIFVDTISKDFRADQFFVDSFKPKIKTGTTSRASIAEDILSKYRVVLTSNMFDILQSYLGHSDNEFKRGRLLISAGLSTFTNDPINDASYKNLISAATKRAKQIAAEEAKQGATQ